MIEVNTEVGQRDMYRKIRVENIVFVFNVLAIIYREILVSFHGKLKIPDMAGSD